MGGSEWAIRFPAFLAGLACILMVFILAKKIFNIRVALVSSAFMASSMFFILYSVNARGYTLVSFLALFGYYCLHRAVKEKQTIWWVLGILSTVLSLYTLPTMVYYYSAVCIWLFFIFFKEIKSKNFAKLKWPALFIVLTPILAFFLYLPVFLNTGISSVVAHSWVEHLAFYEMPNGLNSVFKTLIAFSMQGFYYDPYVLFLFLSPFFVIGGVYAAKTKNKEFLKFAILLFTMAFLFIFVHGVIPFPRTLIYLIPFYYILISAGIVYLSGKLSFSFFPKEKMSREILFLLLLLFTLHLILSAGINRNLTRNFYLNANCIDCEKAVNFIGELSTENESIIISWLKSYPFFYYAKRNGYTFRYGTREGLDGNFIIPSEGYNLSRFSDEHPYFSEPYLLANFSDVQIYYSKNLNRSRKS
ncbi:glycosyltransferase family 39 protein [Candidatus Woesearchaeota archaeon]|nr:glycosyltransferase family 39 protein [Candidatus Woesearchaeota archaeon]